MVRVAGEALERNPFPEDSLSFKSCAIIVKVIPSVPHETDVNPQSKVLEAFLAGVLFG